MLFKRTSIFNKNQSVEKDPELIADVSQDFSDCSVVYIVNKCMNY